MIKRTLLFSSPCYLSVKHQQLLVTFKDDRRKQTVPIEDIGYIILENHSITLSIKLIELLNQYNAAVIFCDSKHMPSAMLQTFFGNSTYAETVQNQIAVANPLKNQLWKRTVEMKIKNQAALLKKLSKDKYKTLNKLAISVKSGDKDNREGVAARIYWKALFDNCSFKRERFGEQPNNLLNYGYAILRAAMARAIAGTGLAPVFGIHHHNKYNAFALVDDIMEPFRPFVDEIVMHIWEKDNDDELTTQSKQALLEVLTVDTKMNTKTPLMLALTRTVASLARSFKQKNNVVEYPVLE
ncbi:MAG: type II CRISPR-associated endonuclease Cas1 [Victivallaceae bacterium]|nr:type II CRISPR-associated endonuclease Cas1 [Victivallaceae bacterium]